MPAGKKKSTKAKARAQAATPAIRRSAFTDEDAGIECDLCCEKIALRGGEAILPCAKLAER